MPVRSLRSSVLRWPDAGAVDRAVRAAAVTRERDDVERIGYFGSYARGTWGVGSDLDLVVVVEDSRSPFERRAASFDTLGLPVPADLLVYTRAEWERLVREGGFAAQVQREACWVQPGA